MNDDKHENLSNNELKNLEENNIVQKYEKGQKSYRPAKYRPRIKVVECAKCGNSFGTMIECDDLYFCQNCVMQRAMEVKNNR